MSARVIERGDVTGNGIHRFRMGEFVIVASLARQGEVRNVFAAAARTRRDVFDGEWIWTVPRRAAAVFASMPRPFRHCRFDFAGRSIRHILDPESLTPP
jgi:hypothetical protein